MAAVAATAVGMAVGRRRAERAIQLGAAVVGSNVGSLLFPFSNPTNLVLVADTGIGFGAYVRAAAAPQAAAAIAAAAVLTWRWRRHLAAERRAAPARPGQGADAAGAGRLVDPASATPTRQGLDRLARAGGLVAVAASAVAVGLQGGDAAPVFAVAAAVVGGLAVAGDRLSPRVLIRSVPADGVPSSSLPPCSGDR